jgi:tripartite-type tricarboxylate transporter receptor subunit TctC
MARPFAAPPGIPPDRAKALQTAFDAAHRDPQFLEEAKKVGVYVSPVTADELRAGIELMSSAPPELFEQVRRLLDHDKGG